MCGELRFYVSQCFFLSRSFPRSIATSLIVVYCSGAGVVSKGNCMQIKASLSNISIQVDTVVVFTWIQR